MLWLRLEAWRSLGLWGLVDKRKARVRNPLANLDPRVITAIREQAAADRLDSSATVGNRFRRRTQNRLNADYGEGVVELPARDTFRRAVDLLLDRRPSDPAYQRASAANQPDRTFGTVIATRPGEVVMIDTTPLDVLAYDPHTDDTVTIELTVALDVATRSILGWRLTPLGTEAIDIGLVLADAMAPEPTRPGWKEALRFAALRIPYQRIVEIDQRLARRRPAGDLPGDAAVRPRQAIPVRRRRPLLPAAPHRRPRRPQIEAH